MKEPENFSERIQYSSGLVVSQQRYQLTEGIPGRSLWVAPESECKYLMLLNLDWEKNQYRIEFYSNDLRVKSLSKTPMVLDRNRMSTFSHFIDWMYDVIYEYENYFH